MSETGITDSHYSYRNPIEMGMEFWNWNDNMKGYTGINNNGVLLTSIFDSLCCKTDVMIIALADY